MHSLRSGSRARSWLAAGAITLGVGVLGGGSWYAASHPQSASLLDSLTQRAVAQEIPATKPQAAAKAQAAPPQAASPNAGNSRRPMGQVTQITSEPAAFTIQGPTGALTTYRVLPTTVFMAGHDRPYRFDLLKDGDTVVIRGGGQGKQTGQGQAANAAAQAPGAAPEAVNRQGKPQAARPAAVPGSPDGDLIARQVMVRPDGERKAGAGNGKKAPGNGTQVGTGTGSDTGAQNGGSNGAGE